MKNLKKILSCIMAVATLGTVSIMPINANADALVIEKLSEETIKYYEENSVKEAIIIIDNAGENSGTYYVGALDYITPSISTDIFTDEDINALNQGFPIKIDDTVDTSAVETVLTFTYKEEESIKVLVDDGSNWYEDLFDITGWFRLAGSSVKKPTEDTTVSDSDTTIGDSDQTIGDSKVTALRGDVNLDGDVNGLDLLYLKKYLLGLIEW